MKNDYNLKTFIWDPQGCPKNPQKNCSRISKESTKETHTEIK